jgi:hypothetical protein
MSKDAFTRMAKSLPALYKAEVNTMIRGLLKSWAVSDDQVSIQLDNTKSQLFVKTAEGGNLDKLGSNVGVNRSPELGIDDGDFQNLVPVLSFYPKQVRATIISLLDVFWGAGFTRPNVSSGNTETYNFGPETLLTGTATFTKDKTTVKGVGTLFLSELQPGDYIKPTSLDGTFYQKVSAVIDNTTLELSVPWSHNTIVGAAIEIAPVRELSYIVDSREERSIRFVPSAFADLSAVTIAEIVAFINSNQEHSPLITADTFLDPVLGSKLNLRTNTPGLQGSIQITGGDANDPARLNFPSAKQSDTRCKVIEVNPNEIVVQIPSSVPVLRRSLKGSAHPRETKAIIASSTETFDFSGLGASSTLTVVIDSTPFVVTFTHASDFADPSKATAEEVCNAINAQLMFMEAKTSVVSANEHAVNLQTREGASEYQVTGGTANTVLNFATTLQQDPDLIVSGFPSSYIYDPSGTLFTVSKISSELSNPIVAGTVSATINMTDASDFPNLPGRFMLDFGRNNQEGPISYTSRPNNSTLLIDASYQFQKDHAAGRKVNFIISNPALPRLTGDDYPVYITGTEEARVAAQDLIKKLLAAGVVIRFIVDFPEFLFVCTCRDCGPSESPDYRGELTASGPLVF